LTGETVTILYINYLKIRAIMVVYFELKVAVACFKLLKKLKEIMKTFRQDRRHCVRDLTQLLLNMSRGSVVGIATAEGLENRGVGVEVPVGSRIFSSPHHPD
jgi:hypothetical protein